MVIWYLYYDIVILQFQNNHEDDIIFLELLPQGDFGTSTCVCCTYIYA